MSKATKGFKKKSEMLLALQRKLHPQRFPNMSGQMCAIVGHVLGLDVTEPAIREIVITADGFVLARHEGDCGMNHFLGAADDLHNNWERLLDCATDLTKEERIAARVLFGKRVQVF